MLEETWKISETGLIFHRIFGKSEENLEMLQIFENIFTHMYVCAYHNENESLPQHAHTCWIYNAIFGRARQSMVCRGGFCAPRIASCSGVFLALHNCLELYHSHYKSTTYYSSMFANNNETTFFFFFLIEFLETWQKHVYTLFVIDSSFHEYKFNPKNPLL